MYTGELISLTVAVSWTVCALFAELASKRMGSLPLNVIRMTLSLVMLVVVMWVGTGVPYPLGADGDTWLWLSLSGFVGYVLGDFCLFNSYILIGSRYGQLLMTLAPPSAALFGWFLLGESMSLSAIMGMFITMLGISIAIFKKGDDDKNNTKISTKGVFYGVCAGIGQGVGLVLSAKGLVCYADAVEAQGLDADALMPYMPFASTAIRAVTGLIGFTVWTALSGNMPGLVSAVKDMRAMLFALGATITGPFVGVSLSLMATQYTSTGIAQTIMALTPIFILLPTYFIFHQRITFREVLGAVVAVGGVTLFFI